MYFVRITAHYILFTCKTKIVHKLLFISENIIAPQLDMSANVVY